MRNRDKSRETSEKKTLWSIRFEDKQKKIKKTPYSISNDPFDLLEHSIEINIVRVEYIATPVYAFFDYNLQQVLIFIYLCIRDSAPKITIECLKKELRLSRRIIEEFNRRNTQ